MSLRRLHRFGFALWLGLLALAASGIAQNQLSANVLVAALGGQSSHEAGGHMMPDGRFMAGDMSAEHTGHTHKGHADCSLCGAVAAMAALAVPTLDTIGLPEIHKASAPPVFERAVFSKTLHAPYASRAPPILIG